MVSCGAHSAFVRNQANSSACWRTGVLGSDIPLVRRPWRSRVTRRVT